MMHRTSFVPGHGYRLDPRDHGLGLDDLTSRRRSRYYNGGPALDQLETPKCVGFGVVHYLGAMVPTMRDISPHGVYELAKYVDEWRGQAYDGTSVRAGVKVIHKLGMVRQYMALGTLEQTVYALLEIGAVLFGSPWLADMFEPNAAGKIFATGEHCGGHCALLDGVDVDRRELRIKCAWGLDWGNAGRAKIDFDDFQRLLDEYDSEVEIWVPRV